MLQNQSLRILEDESEANEQEVEPTPTRVASRYDNATDVELREYGSYSFPRFITAVLEALDKEFESGDAKLVDEIADPVDVDFGILLAYPDETLMFVGSDPTAKDSIPWFSFTVDPMEPMPAPESAQDALDMLKTPSVRDVEHEDGFLASRHGEWWLLPSSCVPAGTVFSPGVSSKPYGASPLGNHVPREYAFTVSDSTFMRKFNENVSSAPSSITTVPEVIEWTWRQTKKPYPPEDAPNWADIRAWAENVLVRGTIRHRDNDHFVENVGEIWHEAQTHDVEVYTGDEMATRVHLDYHGR